MSSRKVDIMDVKRRHKAYDPIPADFGFGVTIQVLRNYRTVGRFPDLEKAVEDRDELFYLGDRNATKAIDREGRRR